MTVGVAVRARPAARRAWVPVFAPQNRDDTAWGLHYGRFKHLFAKILVWRTAMSIGVIATLKIQADKTAEFEAFFGELAKQVRANEPGNLAYQLTKSRTEPGVYKVLEVYKDQDALTHHGGTDYFKAAGPKFGAVLAGRPEIEYLDGVD